MAKGRSSTPDFAALRRGPLQTGEFGPVYVLVGEDQLRIEAAVESMRRKALDPAAAAFNQHVFYGDQTSWQQVLAAAQGFPMLGNRQLVWVRNVDRMERDNGGETALTAYLENPASTTLLVLTAAKVDGRRAWVAAAKKAKYYYAFDPPTGRDLHEWIDRTARRAGLELDEAGKRVLADLVGGDLQTLSEEIDKLALVQESRGRPLTGEDLPVLVMDQADLEVFSLTDYLAAGHAAEVLKTWWRLQTWGSDAFGLSPLVISHLRRVSLAAAMIKDGVPTDEIAAETGLNRWLVGNKIVPLARQFGHEGCHAAMAACLACERLQKRSPTPPDIAFEQLLLEVTTRKPAQR